MDRLAATVDHQRWRVGAVTLGLDPTGQALPTAVGFYPHQRWEPSLCWQTRGMPAHRLPDLDVARVQRWCDERVPTHVRDQVRVECDVGPGHLTILECRPPWREGKDPEWTRFPIARLRYTKASKTWSLYWRDRNLRFHQYDRLAPSPRIDDMLTELERDPTAIFWG